MTDFGFFFFYFTIKDYIQKYVLNINIEFYQRTKFTVVISFNEDYIFYIERNY